MHFTATGSITQHGTSKRAMVQTIRTGRLPPLSWPEATPFTLECKALVERCTHVDASARISISEVLDDLQDWPNRIRFPDSRVLRRKDKQASELEEWYTGIERVHQWIQKKNGRGSGLTRGRAGSFFRGSKKSDGEEPEKQDEAAPEPIEVQPRVPLEFHDPNASLSSVPEVAENKTGGTPEATNQGGTTPEVTMNPSGGARGITPEPTANPSGSANNPSGSPSQDEGRFKYKPTPMATQRLMLTEVMLRWYPETTRGRCCTYHAVLEGLDHLCRKLRKMPCKQKFCLGKGSQCPKCGALDSADDSGEAEGMHECDVCGHEYRMLMEPPRPTVGDAGGSAQHRVAL